MTAESKLLSRTFEHDARFHLLDSLRPTIERDHLESATPIAQSSLATPGSSQSKPIRDSSTKFRQMGLQKKWNRNVQLRRPDDGRF
jgi:hypothetical protein